MAESTKNMTVGAGSASASVTATVTDQMPGVPCPTTPGYTYTGMRYVPVFADPPEWSSANSYEPLEIVLNEGNSYTSKTFVPVGIDISNSTYWALTGNYNYQVEQYRQEVKAFDQRITDNATGVAENKREISAINAALVPLSHSHDYRNANCVFVSDSWGTHKYGVSKPYMEQLSDYLGMNVTNLSVGSTGFVRGGVNNFENRLIAWVNANPQQALKTDYVMVCGSSNDYDSKPDEIRDAIEKFVNYALGAFPNAQIVLIPQFAPIFPAKASTDSPDDNLWRKTNVATIRAFYNAKFERTRIIPDTFYALRFCPTIFMNDGWVHPSQKGHDYLAKWLQLKLLGLDEGSQIATTLSDYTVTSHDAEGNLIETFSTVSAFYPNLRFVDGMFTGCISLAIEPTKAAAQIRLNYPGFVKQNPNANNPFWGTCVYTDKSTKQQTFALCNLRLEDTGKVTSPADGMAWLRFSGVSIDGTKNIQLTSNFSYNCSYPEAGQN